MKYKPKRQAQDLLLRLAYDIKAIRERDPAARSSLEVLLLYPGLHAIILHRPAHWLFRRGFTFTARALSQISRLVTGIEIHPGAKIGKGVFIDHGSGVVIGETSEIGDGCTIYQGVTLGGTGKDKGKRHPTLGKNVTVGSGAKILGPFKIGDGSKIASNAVVLSPLPPGSTAAGASARVVRINGIPVGDELNHVNIPDPLAQEIERLEEKIAYITGRLEGLSKDVKAKGDQNETL